MTFVDVLRQARTGRTAVLHEFWTQYDPAQPRIHAFFEGHDDVVFYRRFLEQYLSPGMRLCPYRCEGKPRVYEAFASITARYPNIQGVFFFVDKDVDDILGEPWPTDPRIFVTDVYSIENYLVSRELLNELYNNSIQVSGVNFTVDALLDRFDEQLKRFHRLVIPLMSWLVTTRRAGIRPNLSNVNVAELYQISGDCVIQSKSRQRLSYLTQVCGVRNTSGLLRRMWETSRELTRIAPKRVVRGKFESWFFVEFWKSSIRQMRLLAREANGNLTERIQLEKSNFVVVLVGLAPIPRSLELFLGQHLRTRGLEQSIAITKLPFHRRITTFVRKSLRRLLWYD